MTETTRQLLAETLEKLRKRIKQIRSKEEAIGEENTKAVLINPLLSALGWNLEDLDEVCQEYKRKPRDNPVDYALFILRSPQLLIEAKDFGKDLNDLKWISQTLSYTTVVGVEWCVLTNGDEYRIYNSHAPVAVEEKLFRTVKISDPTQHEYTLDTLDLLSKNKLGENLIKVFWKAHFIDRHVSIALREIFRGEEKGLVNLIRKKTPELKPTEIRESLKRANIQIDFPVTEIVAEDTQIPTQIQSRTIDDILKRKSPNVQELFLALRDCILGISDAVRESVGDRYCDYLTSTTFTEVLIHRDKLRIFIKMGDREIDDPQNKSRTVPRSFGYGRLTWQFEITEKEEIDYSMKLIRQAYDYVEENPSPRSSIGR
jgi:predicted transport protein